MSLLTIILFFIYTWGFGFSVTFFLKNSDNFLERNLIRIGIGLGVFSVFATFLNLLHIPLDWRIFFTASILVPVIIFIKSLLNKKISKINIKLTKSDIYVFLVLLIFLVHLSIFLKGAFLYPYLEDDDSWDHAKSATYVAIEKTAYEPEEFKSLPGHGMFHYLDPYPPSYPILMGILHQTNTSINWTLKFFNSLIISLGIIFFYFFVKEFTNNQTKALFATFILAIIPSYFSHFIWSLSLSVALFFPAFYCLERKKYDSRWIFIAIIVIAAILLTQTTTALHFGLFLAIYILIKLFADKKLDLLLILAGPIALFLSILLWWGPMYLRYGSFQNLLKGLGQSGVEAILFRETNRFYVWKDFIFVRNTNMINNPVGIGFFLIILLLISLFAVSLTFLIRSQKNKDIVPLVLFIFFIASAFISLIFQQLFFSFALLILGFCGLYLFFKNSLASKNAWIIITIFWLLYSFLSVHGSRLPIRTDYHRSWLIMAIPLSIIVVEGVWFIINLNLSLKIISSISIFIFYLIYSLMASSFNTLEGVQYFVPKISNLFIVFLAILFIFLLVDFLSKQQKLYLKDTVRAILLAEIILFLLLTSDYQKYEVNTAIWPPGMLWTSVDELSGYNALKSLSPNTKIFPMCSDSASKLIGFDMAAYPWRNEGATAYKSYNFTSVDDFYSTLKNKEYEYTIIDGGCTQDKNIGINKTNEIIQVLINSTKFQVSYQNKGMVLFKVL